MTRAELAVYHQERAAELYEFCRWCMRKTSFEYAAFLAGKSNIFYVRLNQLRTEERLAAIHSATARILLEIE